MKAGVTFFENEKIFQLSDADLAVELKSWKRKQIIDWLSWNDPSGIYSDQDSKQEGLPKLSKETGVEIIKRHVSEKYTGRKYAYVADEMFKKLEIMHPDLMHNQKNWPRIVSL